MALSCDATHLLNTIVEWRQVARDEVDDIGGWRDAVDERPRSGDLPRQWGEEPNRFHSQTMQVVEIIAQYSNLDSIALQDIYSAVTTWYEDRSARRVPEQSALLATLNRALFVLAQIERIIREPPQPGSGEEEAKPPAGPKPSVNARMLEALQKNHETRGYTAKQWAKELGCVQSTVVETDTWKSLAVTREKIKTERSKDRRRKKRASEQNRD